MRQLFPLGVSLARAQTHSSTLLTSHAPVSAGVPRYRSAQTDNPLNYDLLCARGAYLPSTTKHDDSLPPSRPHSRGRFPRHANDSEAHIGNPITIPS